jgi:16S rRNA (cytosine1402-N4)-methyltransferase
VPILVEEVLEVLSPRPGDVVADLTLGHGGHARALLARIGPTGRLVALDHDEPTLRATRARLEAEGLAAHAAFHAVHFGALPEVLAREGLDGCDVALADLGLSSMQIDDPFRGFSYRHDGPLDMRMDSRRTRTATTVLAAISEEDLASALSRYGDDPDAERIAKAVVAAREAAPIESTARLAEIVLATQGLTLAAWKERARAKPGESHPAARTFQALRILVNDELAGLERLLRVLPWSLRPGGRVALLSFHSGEDRRVKHAFREGLAAGLYEEVSGRVVRASPAEVGRNPRAAPAKLRWARRARR